MIKQEHTFNFKKFSVRDDLCAMKVGTDGVLLGAWANAAQVKKIIDVGTGCGVIAIMMAQRFPDAHIHALDVDENAYSQALQNVDSSPWKIRIEVFHSSLLEFVQNYKNKYTLIVCNPPYFLNGWDVKEEKRKTARDAKNLPAEQLISIAKNILEPHGNLCVILPVAEGENFILQCEKNKLFCHKATVVFSKENKPPKRLLLAFGTSKIKMQEDNLIIEQQHTYGDKYKKLTKDFYLNF